MAPKYLTANQVRERFGGISDMTLWRWLDASEMHFPKPIYINRRRYFLEYKIRAWAAERQESGNA